MPKLFTFPDAAGSTIDLDKVYSVSAVLKRGNPWRFVLLITQTGQSIAAEHYLSSPEQDPTGALPIAQHIRESLVRLWGGGSALTAPSAPRTVP